MWRPHRWVVYRRCRVYCRGLKVVGVKCTVVHQLPFLWWPGESFTWLSDTPGMPEGDAALPYIPLTNYTLYTGKKCPLVTNEQTNFNNLPPGLKECVSIPAFESSWENHGSIKVFTYSLHGLRSSLECDKNVWPVTSVIFFWETHLPMEGFHAPKSFRGLIRMS